MKTESDLKNKCTPEFIMWMCELAEGFSYQYESQSPRSLIIKRESNYHEFYDWLWIWHSFPLLIHRAVEGWNFTFNKIAFYPDQLVKGWNDGMINRCNYPYNSYQPQSLTQAECAMLDCLIDIFEEEGK